MSTTIFNLYLVCTTSFKKSPKVFDNIFNHLKESVSKRDLTDNYNNYLELFPKLMENDWEIYKEWSHDLYLKDSLAYIIKNDDVEELKKIPSLSPNDRILPTVFEFSLFLSRKPNLFHFSAFYGSEKCFNYLVTLGGDMKAQDYGKRNLIHFALFGGNMNIIQRSVKEISNYDLVTRLAAEFHRFDLFKLFCETNKTDIKSNDLENGSIFHGIAASNHIKMILYCIEQNCDVNLRDGFCINVLMFFICFRRLVLRFWAPLNCAIDYCALDAIHVLLAHKDIDVNMQDEYE